MLNKLGRLYRTVKYLKWIQIWYQAYYRIIGAPEFNWYKKHFDHIRPEKNMMTFRTAYKKIDIGNEGVEFRFLNQNYSFNQGNVNWDFSSYGKLWTYHLNYFDFLADCSLEEGEALLSEYIKSVPNLKSGLEPFPTSIRLVNWIKFVLKFKYYPDEITRFIRSDAERLMGRVEYHIQANHLMENACSLWIASHFFRDKRMLAKASRLLKKQLKEQFHEDGFHYEQSPMYHGILMERLLDCFQISKMCSETDLTVMALIHTVISRGVTKLDWFNKYNNVPQFNDSTNDELPVIKELFKAAEEVGIKISDPSNKSSGYYKLESGQLLVFCDYGSVGPDYQPGHAHADTFSFVLYHNGKQVIADPGISTYEMSKLRDYERSTLAHNTICINGEDSSEVWKQWRVVRRAKVHHIQLNERYISAWHWIMENWKLKIRCLQKRKRRSIPTYTFILKRLSDVMKIAFLLMKHCYLHGQESLHGNLKIIHLPEDIISVSQDWSGGQK